MAEQQRVNRFPGGVVAGIAAAVVAAAGGAAWWTLNSQSPRTPPLPHPAGQSPPKSLEQTAQIYWLKDTGKRLELVASPIPQVAASQTQATLDAAFNRLLAGPQDAGVSSTIPKGTKLRSLKIENDGIHVDLSQEFTTGGGSASMTGRVAQVLYTATSLQPNAKVWIDVEGKPLEYLGGEGVELDRPLRPLTRQGFGQNFTL